MAPPPAVTMEDASSSSSSEGDPVQAFFKSSNKLPGFGKPVNDMPPWSRDEQEAQKQGRFPHAIADYFASKGVTVRERRMLDFINQVTDKPEWERKVFDEEILGKWRAEAGRDVGGDVFLSEKMFEHIEEVQCVLELQEKAKIFEKTALIAVMDAEATVVKSDVIILKELSEALRTSILPLEDVPDLLKDWHPGSDEKVLDLLHPSLFPLKYGLSKALPTGLVPLDECTKYIGCGEKIPAHECNMYEKEGNSWFDPPPLPAWGDYQWLPSNVLFTQNGGVKINSYVNNLHPATHCDLYSVLEIFVAAAIPLWNETLSWFHSRLRIEVHATGREDFDIPEGIRFPRPPLEEDDEEDEEEEEIDDQEWAEKHGFEDNYYPWQCDHRFLVHPEPREFIPCKHLRKGRPGAHKINLRKDFRDSGLQIIFKLANIHLTPEKPEYEGGSWHVEGALNEHICATALYYYDCENVTESYLSFRQSIDVEQMTMMPEQHQHESLEAFFGVNNHEAAIQELGKVNTKEGRLLAFPNVIQHCVQPFSLADRSKPGHRKILAMFLVDPHIPILSTANVPPQRRDWWAAELRKIRPFAGLPEELFEYIIEAVDEFPISWEEALEIRRALMDQRGAMTTEMNDGMEHETFFFCEH